MEKHKQEQSIIRLSKTLSELLESKSYCPGTLVNYRRMQSRISMFMQRRKITEYSESVGEYFLANYMTKKIYSAQYQRFIKTVLRRLDELSNGIGYKLAKQSPRVPAPSQFEGLLEAYMKYCAGIGNKENTIASKRRFCTDFLCHMAEAGCENVCDISTVYICKAVLSIGNKDSFAVIRSFLRHLYENGILNKDFSRIIPKYRRPVPLPTTYSDEEIRLLEGVIDRTTKTGKRNYAVVLLASRLGMRSGDIAGMAFDGIDFDRDSISFIQNKTGQPLSLPLLPHIREAVQDYIWHARPDVKNGWLFIKAKAPFEKISTSIIRHTLTEYFKAAGIDISNKKHGPHTLRSSMASSMVNSDVPYDVVRKALGHTGPQAIKHYAKVDIGNLRLHAIDVPAPTGAFAEVLKGREQAW